MDKTSQRPKKVSFKKTKVLIFVFLALFSWLIVSNIKIIKTYREARINNLSAESNKILLEKEIDVLENKIESIKTEQGIEEHIRLKYPLVKDGERVLIINTEEAETIEKISFWAKISNFIKSIF